MADTLYMALDKARQAFPTIVKNKTNPHFKHRYADLGTVLDAVDGPLREQGLMLWQTVMPHYVETNLIHIPTGEVKACAIALPKGLTDPWKVGSAITYYRRYGVVTILGLVTEDDDDGEATKAEPAATTPRKRGSKRDAEPERPADDSGGWGSPSARAAAHDALLVRIGALAEDRKAGLRAQVQAMGGFPLSTEDFTLVNLALDLFDGKGQIDMGGK